MVVVLALLFFERARAMHRQTKAKENNAKRRRIEKSGFQAKSFLNFEEDSRVDKLNGYFPAIVRVKGVSGRHK